MKSEEKEFEISELSNDFRIYRRTQIVVVPIPPEYAPYLRVNVAYLNLKLGPWANLFYYFKKLNSKYYQATGKTIKNNC